MINTFLTLAISLAKSHWQSVISAVAGHFAQLIMCKGCLFAGLKPQPTHDCVCIAPFSWVNQFNYFLSISP
jgi:hypothetical protein